MRPGWFLEPRGPSLVGPQQDTPNYKGLMAARQIADLQQGPRWAAANSLDIVEESLEVT